MLRSGTFWIVLLIVGLIAADVVLRDGQTLLFLSRKLLELVHWVAFWR